MGKIRAALAIGEKSRYSLFQGPFSAVFILSSRPPLLAAEQRIHPPYISAVFYAHTEA